MCWLTLGSDCDPSQNNPSNQPPPPNNLQYKLKITNQSSVSPVQQPSKHQRWIPASSSSACWSVLEAVLSLRHLWKEELLRDLPSSPIRMETLEIFRVARGASATRTTRMVLVMFSCVMEEEPAIRTTWLDLEMCKVVQEPSATRII